ncbi:MAG: hypothetical protein NVS2B9_12060 [Myxococcales bacterium]
MRILIVDDYVPFARSLQLVLAAEHEVQVCHGGSEALGLIETARAEGQRYDRILCDLGMEAVSGADVWRALSLHGEQDKLVFMTGGATSAEALDFIAGVGNLCLEKPFAPERLFHLLRDRA